MDCYILQTPKGELTGNAFMIIPNNGPGILSFLSNMEIMLEFKSPTFLIEKWFYRYYKFSKTFKKDGKGQDILDSNDLAEIKKNADLALENSYKNKYLVKKNDNEVSFEFKFKGGTMELNGAPFSLYNK